MISLLRWSRRRFLEALALASGGLLFPSACRDAEPTSQPEKGKRSDDALARALRSHFAYLDFRDEVIAAFSADLTKHQGAWNPQTSPPPYTRFLASTDFFQHGADERRALTYVRYYDPYVSPCYNPFGPDAHGARTAATRVNSSGGPVFPAAEIGPSSRREIRSKSA